MAPPTQVGVAAAVLLATISLTGCRDGTVRIAYQPSVGDETVYALHVETDTVLSLDDREEPTRRSSSARMRATQTVLDVSPGSPDEAARVAVRVERAGSPARTFVARLDRAAHVRSIESVEGLPASVLGDVGLPELVPAAAAVVPSRPLRPGQAWTIDAPIQLPGSTPSRLRGSGRLVELGVVDGRDVGVVRSTTRVRVARSTDVADGRIAADGTQTTTSLTRHALDDGSLVTASSTTRATFGVVVSPPFGSGIVAEPVEGTLRVVVRSTVEAVSGRRSSR